MLGLECSRDEVKLATFEERLPLEKAATLVKRFIKEKAPPNRVLDEISRTFIRK